MVPGRCRAHSSSHSSHRSACVGMYVDRGVVLVNRERPDGLAMDDRKTQDQIPLCDQGNAADDGIIGIVPLAMVCFAHVWLRQSGLGRTASRTPILRAISSATSMSKPVIFTASSGKEQGGQLELPGICKPPKAAIRMAGYFRKIATRSLPPTALLPSSRCFWIWRRWADMCRAAASASRVRKVPKISS